MKTEDEKKTTNEKPVVIPLDFKEALAALLKVKPKERPEKKPRKRKKTDKID